jgi:transposase-like protein
MKKRQRRSDAEWQQLIEQQQRSGLSASAFCQQHGLSSKTFYKRRQALREPTKATDSTERFIEIQRPSTPAAATATTAVLHYQRSQLHVPTGVDARWLAQLMQALS